MGNACFSANGTVTRTRVEVLVTDDNQHLVSPRKKTRQKTSSETTKKRNIKPLSELNLEAACLSANETMTPSSVGKSEYSEEEDADTNDQYNAAQKNSIDEDTEGLDDEERKIVSSSDKRKKISNTSVSMGSPSRARKSRDFRVSFNIPVNTSFHKSDPSWNFASFMLRTRKENKQQKTNENSIPVFDSNLPNEIAGRIIGFEMKLEDASYVIYCELENPQGAITIELSNQGLKEAYIHEFMKECGLKTLESICVNVKSDLGELLVNRLDTLANSTEFSKLIKQYPLLFVCEFKNNIKLGLADKSLHEDVEHALNIDRAFENENCSCSRDLGNILACDFLVNNRSRCNLFSDEDLGDPSSIVIINNSQLVTTRNSDFEDTITEEEQKQVEEFLADLKANEKNSNSLFAKRVKNYLLSFTGHEISEYRLLQVQDAFVAKLLDFESKNMKNVAEHAWKTTCGKAKHAEAIDFKFVKILMQLISHHYQ